MQSVSDIRSGRSTWWVLALRGVIAILFGIAVIVWPGPAALVLALFFGSYMFVDGIIATVLAIQERNVVRRWWVLLLEGLAGIAIGILTFISPSVSIIALLTLIAIWAVITGVLEISAGIWMRDSVGNGWLLILAGILSIVLGFLLLVQPLAGIFTIILLVGIYSIVFGVVLVIRAFQFRSFQQRLL